MTLALVNKALAAMLSGVILASCPVAATAQGLPAMGDGADLTTSAERRLGDRIIRELYRDPDYIDDPVVGDYVQGIWQPLLAAAKARGELSAELDERFAWEILLGRDRTVNAFALPGGYLGVHLGLIGVVTTRDELASVLAHELSHVTQRHISRLIAQQNKQTPLLVGALVLAALAASKNPAVTQGLVLGGQALAVQNQLNFSRDMEREADRIGYGLMVPAGFAPQGFVSMFDKLQQANRINDNGSWPYLRSHPLTTERMADMQSRVPPGGASAVALAPTLEHAMVAARARVLSNPGIDTLRQWIAEPKGIGYASLPPARRAAVLYAAALGSSQLRDPAGAMAYAKQLGEVTAQEPAAQRLVGLLNAEIALASSDATRANSATAAGGVTSAAGATPPAGANAALAALAAIAPPPLQAPLAGVGTRSDISLDSIGSTSTTSNAPRRPELLLRTQALLRAGRASEATTALQTWVTTHPKDATAWQLLSAVWQAQGQGLRAIRADAESQMARYDYAAAVDRFKAGQDLARRGGGSSAGGGPAAVDYIEASIIDTRLRAVESLLREQAAER
ncbi:MAG: M48 family metalloprotease [Burkholderiaceae bacterium]|nr:M48 family metalloprotease [Burkholderiaceae bacterium]